MSPQSMIRSMSSSHSILILAAALITLLVCGTPSYATTESYTYDSSARVAQVTYEGGAKKTFVLDEQGNVLKVTTQSTNVLLYGTLALLLPATEQASSAQQVAMQSSLLQ